MPTTRPVSSAPLPEKYHAATLPANAPVFPLTLPSRSAAIVRGSDALPTTRPVSSAPLPAKCAAVTFPPNVP